jgi:Na+-transporting NADH:ubiquinone oxidoreductase subunit C
VLVAGSAVLLKPKQLQNESDYRQRIILDVAGLYEPGMDPGLAFENIESHMVELASGDFVDSPAVEGFDAVAAANDPALGIDIPAGDDIASIHRRARFAPVYLVRNGDRIEQIILPVYGSGLWSTMYGYLSLEGDARTVRGLRFYSHAETPGLGDQVDKPAWRALWKGKRIFDENGEIRITIIRGAVAEPAPGAVDNTAYQVDGLAGATLTGRGVTNLIRYWSGDDGFGPFLDQIRKSNGQRL